MLNLAFLWHMHQPDYRDEEGVMRMPWVFLHAIKDYYDMPWHLLRHPRLKATFNLTPPLIEQLLLYGRKGVECDRFLTLLAKEPQELSLDEREWVIKVCRSSRFDTMVKPLSRFAELFEMESFNDSELVELEVLFLLSWCGNYLRKSDLTVASLIQKGSGFVRSDKEALLESLLQFVPTILPLYEKLKNEGKISLSTTPLNHPILPLLIDMKSAKVSNPKCEIPPNHLSLKDDALKHITRAAKLYKDTFKEKPSGFWPAEGAVDEKSIALYKDHGIEWIATDEEILFRSLSSENRSDIYRPYSFNGVKIFFRDHPLSDLIGFSYRYREAEDAAKDFLSRLHRIFEREDSPTVSVILDGENAWEFYKNSGLDFFDALYSGLGAAKWCETVTFDEAARSDAKRLKKIHPGSWIYGNFDTWVGHPQKNEAWELLFRTKRDYLHHKESLSREVDEEMVSSFLAAESSDWFWWYGEDHHTEYASDFDSLFRERLIGIYRLMKLLPPVDLYRPIVTGESHHAFVSEPKFPIHPIIDGRVSSFFEWLGSGMIDESSTYSTMEGARGAVTKIFWGEDEKSIYIRLDGDMERLKDGSVVTIYANSNKEPIRLETSKLPKRGPLKAAIGSIMEIAVKKSLLAQDGLLSLRIEIERAGEPVQTLPGICELRIDLDDDYGKNWFV